MGISAGLDEPGSLFDCVKKRNILVGHSDQLTAELVVFNDAKAEGGGVKSACGKGFMANRLHIRKVQGAKS